MKTIARFFAGVNINELAFDAAIAVVAAFGVTELFPGGIVPQAGDNAFVHEHLIVLAEFVFALILGKAGKEFHAKNITKNKWRIPYYYIASFYIILVAYIAIPIVLNAVGIFSYAAGFFACLLGFAFGFSNWWLSTGNVEAATIMKPEKKEIQSNKFQQFFEKNTYSVMNDYPVLAGLSILSLFYLITLFVSLFHKASGLLGVLAFVGIIIIPIIGMFVSAYIFTLIGALLNAFRKISRATDTFLMKIIFPMGTAFLFLLWGRIYQFYIIGEDSNIFRALMISLFIGIIPYRILILVKPPVKQSNLVIGLIAMLFYLYSISG